MKLIATATSLFALALSLTACGSDEKTTIIKEQPVVVQQPAPVVISH